jgi:hypothetical protein
MSEPLTLAAFITFAAIGLAIFLGFAWFALGYLRSIEKSSTKIEAGMERAISELGRLFPIIGKPANPEPDKFALVQKLQEGRINPIEAQKLAAILEKERDEAVKQRDWILLASIIALLILLAMKK